MDTLEVIKYLMNEIEEEIKLNEEYNTAIKRARLEAKVGDYWGYHFNWHKAVPRKALINQNLRKIRQLTLKLEREGVRWE